LDALDANIAVIDRRYAIVMVNEAWRKFGIENSLPGQVYCVGTNYIGVCLAACLDAVAKA